MKKIILVLVILSSVFASGSMAGAKFGIGAIAVGNGTVLPSVRMDFDRQFGVELTAGFTSISQANASRSIFNIGSRFLYNFMPSSQFTPCAGGDFLFQSDSNLDGAGHSGSTLTFALEAGGMAYLGKNFSIYALVSPISFSSTSVNNASITTLAVAGGSIGVHYYF